MTLYNNGPAFSSCFHIQITGTCLGKEGLVTAPSQFSPLIPQMNNAALSAAQSPGPEMLWTVSLIGCRLSLLNSLLKTQLPIINNLEKYETDTQTFSLATLTTSACLSSRNYPVSQSQCLSNIFLLLPQEAYHSQTSLETRPMLRPP